ncbi:intraflagellar transport-associated protein isoform X2 [Physeter macrocephalus]|uniref:Intraflagellar transport-associated protein isoform X2 n=1 Tax=Physeter macrocephalus TaxID=9755 RepID=A0A455C9R5_PHYMC|nr:intraflagellar transport-associated protein isoform X2 [Physeter catodon]|eukprot:XP_028357378.1 uncharacterized protein C11orf74 homolog isoform X2 [Physeter catodon]
MNRNACQIPELEVMDEDQHIEDVLDKFVNCHEQTYEEFLSTFTHLSKDNVTKRGAFGTNSSENNFTSVKFTQRNEPNDHHLSNKASFLRTLSQCSEEEQIVMDEGQKVGSSFQGDLNRAGKVKVDNFLDLEDLDLDEEIKPQMSKSMLSVSFLHCLTSFSKLQIVGDEVRPFSLDEEFDYDAVTLTPKFTPAEIDAIKELCKQKRKSTDLEKPRD